MQGLPEEDRRRIGAYLSLGTTYAFTILAFTGLGWIVDRWLATSPAFTLIGVFLGGAAAFYNLVRRVREIEKDAGAQKEKNGGSSGPSGKAPDRQ